MQALLLSRSLISSPRTSMLRVGNRLCRIACAGLTCLEALKYPSFAIAAVDTFAAAICAFPTIITQVQKYSTFQWKIFIFLPHHV